MTPQNNMNAKNVDGGKRPKNETKCEKYFSHQRFE